MIASIPVLAALISVSLSSFAGASALLDLPTLHGLDGRDLLPLGANCTTDAQCDSSKCWPQVSCLSPLIPLAGFGFIDDMLVDGDIYTSGFCFTPALVLWTDHLFA